jgi:hypothetical protein
VKPANEEESMLQYGLSLAGVTMMAALLSCSSTTGTKITSAGTELLKIKKAGIVVLSEHPISVRVARDNMTNTGAILFGLVGAAVEAGLKASKDSTHEENIGHFLGDFDPVNESALALRDKFLQGQLFPIIEIVQRENDHPLKERGFDAVFKETIEEWGLRLCSGAENVRVGFDIHAKLVALESDSTVWERDELFLDGPCRPLSDFKNDPQLLQMSLRRAMQTLAGKIANDIAFP